MTENNTVQQERENNSKNQAQRKLTLKMYWNKKNARVEDESDL